MPTQQIPQERWNDFLSAFSAHNQTRKVTIETETSDLGSERLVDHRPLLAIEPDLEDEHDQTIAVVVGDPEGASPSALTHQVMNPRTIWVKQDDEGRAEALDIEMEDGRTIITLD